MPLPCARCQTPLPQWELVSGNQAVCTNCSSPNTVQVFPAFLAARQAAIPAAAAEGEASCFDHPGKLAVAACSQCGRFVCLLCSVDLGGATWCPSCVALGAGAAQAARTDTARNLYDSVALILPLASLVFWPLTFLTGPATVVFSFLRWNRPLSLVRRFRWRFVVAIVLGLAETAAWIWGILYFMARAKMGKS